VYSQKTQVIKGGKIMNTITKKRKSILAIGLIAAVLLIGTGVGFYLKAPNSMIAIDINPSIELHTNRLNQVVSINPVNEDAVQLMAGYQLKDRDLEDVIEDIVDRMILGGYLITGQENQILITGDDTNTSVELLSKVNTAISAYLQQKQLQAELLQQRIEISDADEEIAHDNDVSAGKMAIINKLLENNNGLTTEELASASIKELVQLSIDYNISLEDLIDNYSDVMENHFDLEDILDSEDADDAEEEDMQDEDDDNEAKDKNAVDQDDDADNNEDRDKDDRDEEDQDEENRQDLEDQDDDQDKEDEEDQDDQEDQDDDADNDEDSDYDDNEDSEDEDDRKVIINNNAYNSKEQERNASYDDDEDSEDEDNSYEEERDEDGDKEDNHNEDSQGEDHDREDEEDNDQGDED
jgi:hypothetical protein